MINNNFDTLTPEGKINFAGVAKRFFDDVVKDVILQSTKDSYSSMYNNVILPVINSNIFVEDLTFEYIENIKNRIVKENNYYGSTVDRVWMLLTKPINLYYKQLNKQSPFAKIVIDDGEQEKIEIFEKFNKIIKSFTPLQELEIICYLFEHIEDGGEIMGIAIMFFFVIRENESCGTVFGSYKEMQNYKGCHYLDTGITTTNINSNTLKHSTKTKNGPREDVTMELFTLLYNKRLNFVKEKTGCNDVMDYPMVCKGNDFKNRCSTPDLSKAGRILLQDILHIKDDDYEDLDYLLKHADIFDTEDKEPTTYLFRRNSATRKYHLGYSLTEIQYSMGHELTDSLLPNSSLSDEEILHKMWLLEQQHPLNKLMNGYMAPVIEKNTNEYNANLDGKGTRLISIKGKEFNDPVQVYIECDSSSVTDTSFYDFPSKYVNILTDMYEVYAVENKEKWRSAKEIVNK